MDIQAVADMEQFVDRLDKRIYDLQLLDKLLFKQLSNSYDSKRESSIS